MELKVDGRRVHAATGGRAFDPSQPAVIFLHGAGLDHTIWQPQSRWFAWHGYAALAVDLPGHGLSEGAPLRSIGALAQWTDRLMEAAGLSEAALIGHSMGAAIALEVAARVPTRVKRIALLGAGAAIPVHPDLIASARDCPVRAYRMMTAWAHSPGAKLGGHPVPGLWMAGGTQALFARNKRGVLHADLEACNAWRTGADAAAKTTCPALVIVAANDVMVPAAKGQELARLIAGSQCVALPDCGHMLLIEAPGAVLDALAAFFTPG
jgi:pimeloyl-ACP methyl ester carboxylesterase